jgi:hypothetical protein
LKLRLFNFEIVPIWLSTVEIDCAQISEKITMLVVQFTSAKGKVAPYLSAKTGYTTRGRVTNITRLNIN